jgi:hypothetical protein
MRTAPSAFLLDAKYSSAVSRYWFAHRLLARCEPFRDSFLQVTPCKNTFNSAKTTTPEVIPRKLRAKPLSNAAMRCKTSIINHRFRKSSLETPSVQIIALGKPVFYAVGAVYTLLKVITTRLGLGGAFPRWPRAGRAFESIFVHRISCIAKDNALNAQIIRLKHLRNLSRPTL